MPTPRDAGELFDRYFDDVYGYIAYRLSPRADAAGDIQPGGLYGGAARPGLAAPRRIE